MEKRSVNGVGLAWDSLGEGRPLALLNGIAMSMAHWKPVAERLAASGRRVILHDFRGQTLSDKPEGPYSLALHARDLAALLDSLGVEKIDLVGTSYGAEVALSFAVDYPERAASLVLIDGVSEADATLRAAVESWKAAALANPVLFYKTILPWNYSAAWISANAEILARREAAVAALPRDWFEAFVRLCDAFLAIDLTPRLGAVRAPTLALCGEKDILKHEGYSRIITEGIAGAEFERIPGAGHAAVIERPDFVAERILDFLSRRG